MLLGWVVVLLDSQPGLISGLPELPLTCLIDPLRPSVELLRLVWVAGRGRGRVRRRGRRKVMRRGMMRTRSLMSLREVMLGCLLLLSMVTMTGRRMTSGMLLIRGWIPE
uniref:Uncharacterized protein n=1 Tax=Opuntia streptacantha TaxID=393608 RepID=A0A7C9A6E3_OPUST